MKRLTLTSSLICCLLALAFSASSQAQDYADLSPRAFCRATGGIVTETVQANMYLCCYEKLKKCVLSDTDQEVSWHISIQTNEEHRI